MPFSCTRGDQQKCRRIGMCLGLAETNTHTLTQTRAWDIEPVCMRGCPLPRAFGYGPLGFRIGIHAPRRWPECPRAHPKLPPHCGSEIGLKFRDPCDHLLDDISTLF